jgi:hypothetical protein
MRQIIYCVLLIVLLFAGPKVTDAGSYDSGQSDWLEEDARDWQRTYEPTNVPKNQQSVTALPTPVTPTVNQQQVVVPPKSSQHTNGGGGILSILFPWLGRRPNSSGSQQSETAVSRPHGTASQSRVTQPSQPNLIKPSAGERGAYSPTPSMERPSGLIRPRMGSSGSGDFSSSYVVDLRKHQPRSAKPKLRSDAAPGARPGLIKPTIPGSKPKRSSARESAN